MSEPAAVGGRVSLRRLLAAETPLVTPVAHDALSARLIEQAGFQAIGIGGSAMLAARYALPDLGLAALGEMADGIRDILAATRLPVIVDGDDGYGGVKHVARLVETYGALGVAAIILEDQVRELKQQGDDRAIGLAPPSEMVRKLRTALAARAHPDLLVVARCDAYQVEGLDAALRRAEAYLKAGADGIMIPGVRTPGELAAVGAAFRGTYQIVALFEGRQTPWLAPRELAAMGYSQVVYPAALMMRLVATLTDALDRLRAFAEDGGAPAPAPDWGAARAAWERALRLHHWQALERTEEP